MYTPLSIALGQGDTLGWWEREGDGGGLVVVVDVVYMEPVLVSILLICLSDSWTLSICLWYSWKHGTMHRLVRHSGQWYLVFRRNTRPWGSVEFQQKLQPRAGPPRSTGQCPGDDAARMGVPDTARPGMGVTPRRAAADTGGPASRPESCETLCTSTEGPADSSSVVCSAGGRVSPGSSLTARGPNLGGPVMAPYPPPPPPPPLSSEGVRRMSGTSFLGGRSRAASAEEEGLGWMGRREVAREGVAPPVGRCLSRTG